MEVGTVVTLQKKHYVLVEHELKRAKGLSVVREFRLLRPKDNFALDTKPYTHAREALCQSVKLNELNQSEANDLKQLQKWHFYIRDI